MKVLLGCLAAAALAAAPRPLATVSLELHSHVIFVKASVTGSPPLDMVLDSGSVRTTLDEGAAVKLGLDLSLKAQSTGLNGLQQISVLKEQTVSLAGLQANEPVVVVYDLGFLAKKLGHRVDGIVGVELFRNYVIEIDYASARARIFAPQSYSYTGEGEVVRVTYFGRLPLIAGSLTPYSRTPVRTFFQVDTGAASTSVALWKPFIERHDLLSAARGVRVTESTGFGGSAPAREGTLEKIEIGHLSVPDPPVRFLEAAYGNPDLFGGNLGSAFLERFKVVFDLPHDRMIFEKP